MGNLPDVSTNEVLKDTSRSEFEPDAAGGGLTKSPMLEKLPDANNQSLEARAALSASRDYWPRSQQDASPSAQLEPSRA
jgi:hypothetical protein